MHNKQHKGDFMVFYSAKELRASSKNIFNDLDAHGEAIITNNGRPAALMLSVSGYDPEVLLRAVRQAKAMLAFNRMRAKAQAKGPMTPDEIQAEIDEYRLEKRQR
jgi:PHD/YefM family antitoxin component YafN of YafNO toxin-antitoxin module